MGAVIVAWLAPGQRAPNCYPVMLQRYNRRKLQQRMLILADPSSGSGSPTPDTRAAATNRQCPDEAEGQRPAS